MRSRLGTHFFVEIYILCKGFCIVIYSAKCYYILIYISYIFVHILQREVYHCG